MTGLEKIVGAIGDVAKSEAQSIVDAARRQASGDAAQSDAEVESAVRRIQQESERALQADAAAFESAMALSHRRRTLKTRQALIIDALAGAADALRALPVVEYFQLMTHIVVQNAQVGSGRLLLNAKDRARVPATFADELAAALPDGKILQIADETRAIDGGFVLEYAGDDGVVEQNCSFAAIFDERHDEFADAVAEVLFA